MKTMIPLLITLFSFGVIQGQDLFQVDVRLGAGSSFITSGDHRAMTLDGEINYHFSDFLSLGAGLTAGSSSSGNIGTMSFFHQRVGA